MRVTRRRRRNFTRLYILIACILTMLVGFAAASCMNDDTADTEITEKLGIKEPDEVLHVMVMGVDRRSDDVGRSDTLMVVSINKTDEKAEILSLPRDTRVKIEKNGYDKINHAYAYGEAKLTRQTVEDLLGVPMDYYLLVDVRAFERIIDAIDGIDLEVEKRMYYEDPWDDNGGLVIDLYPGMQHMDGERAIQYVRYRDAEGDLGRVTRQQHFMQVVVDKILSPSILPKLPKVMEEVRSSMETDMPLSEMVSMAQMAGSIKEHGMETIMLPGMPAYYDDISYWLPNIMEMRELVAEQMDAKFEGEAVEEAKKLERQYENARPDGMIIMEEDAISYKDKKDKKSKEAPKSKKDISILIINDSGINGAAARLADKLREDGYNVTGVDTGKMNDREETIIMTDEVNSQWFEDLPYPIEDGDDDERTEAVIHIGRDFRMSR